MFWWRLARVSAPAAHPSRRGLLHRPRYANLGFCAAVCAEHSCVRVFFGTPEPVSAVVWAGVAQLVEHLICNQRVGGSNPFASSTLRGSGVGSGRKFGPVKVFVRRACPLR